MAQMFEEKDYSLIFCLRRSAIVNELSTQKNSFEILLGLKKRGFGVGKWNGFGGKLGLNLFSLLHNQKHYCE
jgi:hypothetical protein